IVRFGVDGAEIAGPVPTIDEVGIGMPSPVAVEHGRPANHDLADLTRVHALAVLIGDPDLCSGHRLPNGAFDSGSVERVRAHDARLGGRSEEHTSELQSL